MNTWVSYIDRTYQQIKDKVLTLLNSKVPEMTDNTEQNLFVKLLSIWSGIAEMLGYNIDQSARESHISSARLYQSMILLAEQYDYRIKAKLAASADVTFTINQISVSDVNIQQGTEIENVDGLIFYTAVATKIPAGELSVVVSAVQRILITNEVVGNTTGILNERMLLNANYEHDSGIIKVNGDNWTLVDTLAYSQSTDKHYINSVNSNKIPYIQFGDSVSGVIPTNGSAITIDYYQTQGATGNVAPQTIKTINSTITLPPDVTTITVTNLNEASGGADFESLESLKVKVPLSIRTLKRAVTKEDYEDIAIQASGVINAVATYECGQKAIVYIVPEGGGIASQLLKDAVTLYFQDKILLGVNVDIRSAGEVVLNISANVYALKNYQKSVVKNNVEQALLAKYSWENQTIKGNIRLSDIFQTIETSEGVDYSEILDIKFLPYAAGGDIELDWQVNINSYPTEVTRWLINITATGYQVLQNGAFLGNFLFNNALSLKELSLRVNTASYTIGDSYEFYTYPNILLKGGSIALQEYSVPICKLSKLSITVVNGI